MTTWVIGDLQGCRAAFERLLERIAFDDARDRLWLVGDLVNRGPDSPGCLRLVRQLGEAATTVLGNHDLHLLGAARGLREARPRDTIAAVLDAPDAHELLGWLAQRPLLHRDGTRLLVHAALAPAWTPDDAEREARALERALRGDHAEALLRPLPAERVTWSDELTGVSRHAAALSFFTRVRLVDEAGGGDLVFSGPPGDAPDGLVPWFDAPGRRSAGVTVACGHWSALGLLTRPDLVAVDTGCVWGRSLSAVDLDDRRVVSVDCAGG